MGIPEILNYLSAGSAALAAFFWYMSATVKPSHEEKEPDDNGWTSASITVNGSDLSDTLKEQSKRSATAAIFAAIAAILQAVSTII